MRFSLLAVFAASAFAAPAANDAVDLVARSPEPLPQYGGAPAPAPPAQAPCPYKNGGAGNNYGGAPPPPPPPPPCPYKNGGARQY